MRPAPLTLPPRWAGTGTSARQTHEVIFRAGKRRDLVWSSGRTCASTWHATSSSAAVSSPRRIEPWGAGHTFCRPIVLGPATRSSASITTTTEVQKRRSQLWQLSARHAQACTAPRVQRRKPGEGSVPSGEAPVPSVTPRIRVAHRRSIMHRARAITSAPKRRLPSSCVDPNNAKLLLGAYHVSVCMMQCVGGALSPATREHPLSAQTAKRLKTKAGPRRGRTHLRVINTTC